MIAWREYCDELEDLERIAYGAQGIKLPPKRSDSSPSKDMAAEWRMFKASHNARLKGRGRARKTEAKIDG